MQMTRSGWEGRLTCDRQLPPEKTEQKILQNEPLCGEFAMFAVCLTEAPPTVTVACGIFPVSSAV